MKRSNERKIKPEVKAENISLVINRLNGQYTILVRDGEGAVKSDMVTEKRTMKTLQ